MARWTELQVQFLIWLNLAPREREHKTEAALAEYLGIHYNTLCNWKKLPGWNDAVQKAGWYVIEQTNHLALQQSRFLAQTSDDLKSQADYYRWILPLAMKARTSGYFKDLEPNSEEETLLPEELVLQEVNKLPLDQQLAFEPLLRKLGYLRSEQAVVDAPAKDIMAGLMKPLEEQEKPAYRNVSKRKSRRSIGQEYPQLTKALPAATPIPKGRKRHFTSDKTRTIEL